MDKKDLRREIRLRKQSLAKDERTWQSERLCREVLSQKWWMESRVVLLYSALPDEVDVQRLIDDARLAGKVVLLPVVVGDILQLHSFEGETKTGAYGIEEPVVKGDPFADFAKIDVAIIPGMAFDGEGHRLGRGKGYYDRLLQYFDSVLKIGVCFDFQFLDAVPSQSHDICMNMVLHA